VSAFTDYVEADGIFPGCHSRFGVPGLEYPSGAERLHQLQHLNFGAIRQVYESIDYSSLIAGWLFMMVHSLFILWTLPAVLFYLWLLIRLWREGDLFQNPFPSGDIPPIHTFIYLQRMNPLSAAPWWVQLACSWSAKSLPEA
jgi:hypothetical protein